MIQCYLCHKDIPDDVTEYDETRVTIISKLCDECLDSENRRLGFKWLSVICVKPIRGPDW